VLQQALVVYNLFAARTTQLETGYAVFQAARRTPLSLAVKRCSVERAERRCTQVFFLFPVETGSAPFVRVLYTG
jgi:hypothetical protein